jgi:hypothetical protein
MKRSLTGGVHISLYVLMGRFYPLTWQYRIAIHPGSVPDGRLTAFKEHSAYKVTAGPIHGSKLVLHSLYPAVIVIVEHLSLSTLIMRSRWLRP